MKSLRSKRAPGMHGTVLVLAMIFLAIFSSLAVTLASFADVNNQVASNQEKVNDCLSAAQSGLEIANYIINTVSLAETGNNTVSNTEAEEVWSDLYSHILTLDLNNATVNASASFTDSQGSGDEIVVTGFSLPNSSTTYNVRFYRYDDNLAKLYAQSTGQNGNITRSAQISMYMTKDSEVLHYAIAGRGRMWLTGDTTIYGDIFSSWDRADISPFNITSDSSVEGTINTVLSRSDIEAEGYQMETLDTNGNPIDANGDPLTDNYADRYANESTDEILGYHEGINYDQVDDQMGGMDISDYDTSLYYDRTYANDIGTRTTTTTTTEWVNIGTRRNPNYVEQEVTSTSDNTVTEYFPHGTDGYDDYKSGARTLTRYVYENETFTDAYVPSNRNALFENCTFEGVLYIDCAESTSTNYNNIRFNDCTFNGVIVTNTPSSLKWQYNALYFTGEATFNNTSDIQEATVLAPHFNVDLGNTNSDTSTYNVLKGAVVGGIVDVRGNCRIEGTIISMCDTTGWDSGFVTNIGATLEDGGSETTSIEDVGVIEIEPEEEQLLPSGITTPIIIKTDNSTYCEG